MACGGGRIKLSYFWLNHEDASLFAKSQWPVPQSIYLAWRVFLALFTSGWLVAVFVSYAERGKSGSVFVFYTQWTYLALTLYAVSSCVGSFYFTFVSNPTSLNERRPFILLPSHEEPTLPVSYLPIYFKLVWLTFNICLGSNLVITIIYWSFLAPPHQPPVEWAFNINLHILNAVFIYTELAITAIPVRLVHFVYGLVYGLLYSFFTLIYYFAGGVNPDTKSTAIYPGIIDWSHAGRTVLAISMASVFECLVFIFTGYGVYRLRIYIHRR